MWLVATTLDSARCWTGLSFNMNKNYGSDLNSSPPEDKICRQWLVESKNQSKGC